MRKWTTFSFLMAAAFPIQAADGPADATLHFLQKSPEPPPHFQQMHITIDADSLKTGLVKVDTCHYHLDPVPALQVVFGKRLKALQIKRADNIEKVWVEGRSVQLQNVHHHAVLCLQLVSKVLDKQEDGAYVMKNGPFMRRFLDGYFPFKLDLSVSYPPALLRFAKMSPAMPSGAITRIDAGEVNLKVLFEGALNLKTRFEPAANTALP